MPTIDCISQEVARLGLNQMPDTGWNDIIAIIATDETAAAFHIVTRYPAPDTTIFLAEDMIKYISELDPNMMCTMTVTANDEHSITLVDRIVSAGIQAQGIEAASNVGNLVNFTRHMTAELLLSSLQTVFGFITQSS